MRRLLLALPFTLLPLAMAQAQNHEHEHEHEHGSLAAHEHGVAQLSAALDGKILELELQSPAMNLVGFEHAPSSDADKQKLATARIQLEKPLELFVIPAAADCKVLSKTLDSPPFASAKHRHEDEHSEIRAHYQLECSNPSSIQTLDLSPLFARFPDTGKIRVQLIGPNGQQGAELSADAANLSF